MDRRNASLSIADPEPSRRTSAPWTPLKGWRHLLAVKSPRHALERLVGDEDPLALRSLCAQELRSQAILVDLDRVHLRSLARIVFRAVGEADPGERTLVLEEVRAAVRDIQREDRRRAGQGRDDEPMGTAEGAEALDPRCSAFAVFARPLGFTEQDLLRACVSFNGREVIEREAFFQTVVERRSLDEVAKALGLDLVACARLVRCVLDRCLSGLGSEGSGEVQ